MDARSSIVEAFRSVVMETPSGAISVAAICAKAGVSKKTYYNHFGSRQALINAVIDYDFFAPQRQLRQSLFPSQLEAGTSMLLQLTYETLKQQWPFYQRLLEDIGREPFVRAFMKLGYEMNLEVYAPEGELTKAEQTELEYFCFFIASTNAQSLLWWEERGFEPSVAEMADLYYRWSFARLDAENTPYPSMCATTARQ